MATVQRSTAMCTACTFLFIGKIKNYDELRVLTFCGYFSQNLCIEKEVRKSRTKSIFTTPEYMLCSSTLYQTIKTFYLNQRRLCLNTLYVDRACSARLSTPSSFIQKIQRRLATRPFFVLFRLPLLIYYLNISDYIWSLIFSICTKCIQCFVCERRWSGDRGKYFVLFRSLQTINITFCGTQKYKRSSFTTTYFIKTSSTLESGG